MGSFFTWLASLFSKVPSVPAAIIADIQAATVSLCKFLPYAESVETLITTTYPTAAASIAIVDPIAQAICRVVSTAAPPTAVGIVGAPTPSFVVHGVPIQGRFVG